LLGGKVEYGALIGLFRGREVKRVARPNVERQPIGRLPVVLCEVLLDVVPWADNALLQVDLKRVHLANQEAGDRVSAVCDTLLICARGRKRRPKRGDGAVSVSDRAGKRLKIPMWMLSPASAEIRISERAVLNKESLLLLSSVLAIQTRRDHDNLQPIAVDVCEGGNRGATRIAGSGGPRSPSGTRKRDGTGRPGRSDGALSSRSVSSRRRKT
jgi:hypothetical protein